MKNKSFTLIELLVVIVIIGILAGVIMISTSSSIDKANIAKSKVFEESVENNLIIGAISRWKLDGDANDSWGGNNGTISGVASETNNCITNTCMRFSGSSYIELTDNQELRLAQGGTIAAWIFPLSSSDGITRRIIDKSTASGGTNGYFFGITDTNKIILRVAAESPYLQSNNTINHEKWSFVVATFDSAGKRIYINATDLTQSNTITALPPSDIASVVRIGRTAYSTAFPFNGLMDDIRIYNTALSSSQIKQNYIAGLDSMLSNGTISKEEYNERINNLAYDK